jgi:hypothetical protein
MRSHWIGTILLLATLSPALSAQNPLLPAPRSPCDFDKIRCEYSGVINVSAEEGGSREVIAASVARGIVDCIVRYTDEEGTKSARGPGLLEISLGLVPAPEELPAGARDGIRMYTVRVACPNAMYDPPHEARWSHPYDSYKQLGGEIGLDARGQAILPARLEGSYNDAGLQMSWRLCSTGVQCAPPPPGPGPQP